MTYYTETCGIILMFFFWEYSIHDISFYMLESLQNRRVPGHSLTVIPVIVIKL